MRANRWTRRASGRWAMVAVVAIGLGMGLTAAGTSAASSDPRIRDEPPNGRRRQGPGAGFGSCRPIR